VTAPPTPDLPVAWWALWLVVMAVVVFAALAWWLTREALREDAELPASGRPPADGGRPADGRRPADRDRLSSPSHDPHEPLI